MGRGLTSIDVTLTEFSKVLDSCHPPGGGGGGGNSEVDISVDVSTSVMML